MYDVGKKDHRRFNYLLPIVFRKADILLGDGTHKDIIKLIGPAFSGPISWSENPAKRFRKDESVHEHLSESLQRISI